MINVQQRLCVCVCVYDCVHVCGVCLPEAEMKLKQLLTPPTAYRPLAVVPASAALYTVAVCCNILALLNRVMLPLVLRLKCPSCACVCVGVSVCGCVAVPVCEVPCLTAVS